ncbi:hypothetical protein [Iodidimonas gelatinilytica]|uniref:hypothetical protein n=1 Tax=Iodidimonas gelatinilytica TaxID=1236966 RepID=UPI001B2FECE5|nr:hypothetical protein [Iodidimonas gelatinilytica]
MHLIRRHDQVEIEDLVVQFSGAQARAVKQDPQNSAFMACGGMFGGFYHRIRLGFQ